MKLRKWTAEEKMAIVLEGIKGQRSVADICREHKINQSAFSDGGIVFLSTVKKD